MPYNTLRIRLRRGGVGRWGTHGAPTPWGAKDGVPTPWGRVKKSDPTLRPMGPYPPYLRDGCALEIRLYATGITCDDAPS